MKNKIFITAAMFALAVLLFALSACSNSEFNVSENQTNTKEPEVSESKIEVTEEITPTPSPVYDVNEFVIADFEDGIPDCVSSDAADVELIGENTLDGTSGIKVHYKPANFPTVRFTPEDGSWNFGEGACLVIDVTNPSYKEQTIYIRVDDDENADGQSHSMIAYALIPPNTSETINMTFAADAEGKYLGMHGLPQGSAGSGMIYGWGEKNLDLSHITRFEIWLLYNKEDVEMIYDNVRIMVDPAVDSSYTDNLVDVYGQYNKEEWDGKIHSDEELVNALNKEKEALNNTGRNSSFSKYGGWADGSKYEATGYFRTEKIDDKWAIIDPEGYLYFATGVDCVRFDDAYTWVTGRENMFVEVPENEGETSKHYTFTDYVAKPPMGLTEGWIYNYYTANLERKYGNDYANEWREMTLNRFKDWGFTSLGNWSDEDLFFGKGEEMQMPYTANIWVNGDHAMLSSGSAYWPSIADPYDPEFRVSVQNQIDNLVLKGVDTDPWCMGVYVDNEIAWGHSASKETELAVISAVFLQDAKKEGSYAKRALIEELKVLYNDDIEALSKSWGYTLKGWSLLNPPFMFTEVDGYLDNENLYNDLNCLLEALSGQYYSVIDEELNKSMPNTLYLGSRFAEWGAPRAVQMSCAKYVDIVSFNIYSVDVNQSWIYADEMDKPLIVGEFHFGATDRGMFKGGLVPAGSQEERGEMYQAFVTSAANSNYFVGAHWFQYVDQPLIGRAWDGENNNVGFVDITDTPYELLVEAAKEIHGEIYFIKYGDN